LHGLALVGRGAIVVVRCAHLPFGRQPQLSLLRRCNGSIVTATSFMLLLDGERELCVHSVQWVFHVGLRYRPRARPIGHYSGVAKWRLRESTRAAIAH
jgi:hypothetical protein